jgi:hypothetical protein
MKFPSGLKIVSILAMLIVFFAGSAWAEDKTYVLFTHQTSVSMVDGKPDYTKNPFNNNAFPYFGNVNIELGVARIEGDNITFVDNLPNGTATLNPNKDITVRYEDSSGNAEFVPYPAGEIEFYLNYEGDGDYVLCDENGRRARFWGGLNSGNETAFSGTAYQFNFGGLYQANGNFGTVRTVEDQMLSKCVPYIETIIKGGKIVGIKYRFVDPETLETVSNSDIGASFRIYLNDGNESYIGIGNDDGYYYDGKEYRIDVPSAVGSIDPAIVDCIRIWFSYKSDNPNGYYPGEPIPQGNIYSTEYSWRFYGTFAGSSDSPDDPKPDEPEPEYIIFPSSEDVEQAEKDSEGNLDVQPTRFDAAKSADVKINGQIEFDGEEITRERTLSAISIKQDILDADGEKLLGGAVVLGTAELPLTSKSLDGIAMQNVDSLDELAGKYSVIKGFDGGGSVDLLKLYGRRAFGFDDSDDTNKKVIITATIIVIDDEAPPKTVSDDINRPFANENFGVKLSEDNKYLYVYDGNENGTASDPIALVAKTDDNNNQNNDDPNSGNTNNSGGGCSTSSYAFALIVLVCASMLIRAKRKEA